MTRKSSYSRIIYTLACLIYLLHLSSSSIFHNVDIIAPTGYSFTTLQITQDHIVHISQKNLTPPIVSYYTPDNIAPINGTIWGTVGNTTARIRTSPQNSNLTNPQQQLSFLYFTPQALQLSKNFTSFVYYLDQSILLSSVTVQQVCFGRSTNQMFLLFNQSRIISLLLVETYSVAYYNGTTQIGKVYFNDIDPTINTIDQFFYSDGYLFMLFTASLRIYTVTNVGVGAIVFVQNFTQSPKQTLDLEVNNLIVTFSINSSLYQYDLVAGQYILSYIFPTETINSITMILNSCYLIVKTNTTAIQFDVCINEPIFRYPITSTSMAKVSSFGVMGFGLYVDSTTSFPSKYSLFNLTNDYPSNESSGCLPEYSFDNQTFYCFRERSTANSSNQFNISFNPVSQNISALPTTPTISTDQTVTDPPNNQYTTYIDQLLPTQTTQTMGTVLILASLKVTPSFLLVFTLFLNDLWYYKYHHKQNPPYPNTTKIFMDKVDLIKYFQLNPDLLPNLLPFLQESSNSSAIYQNNVNFSKYLGFNSNDPDRVYFLFSTEQVYKNALIISLLFFAGLKILHFILYGCRHMHKIIYKTYLFVKYQTKWWTVLVGVIQANGILLAFSCGLQMDLFGLTNWLDKLNIVYMVLVLFLIIFYSCSFYWIIGLFQNKRCAETILVYTKVKGRSLRVESLIILARSFIKSFFHSFFLMSYPTQITLLLVVDLIFMVMTLRIGKLYKNRCIFLFIAAYFIGFSIFDLSFALQQFGVLKFSSDANRQLFGLILCGSLSIISILLCLSVLFEALYQIYKLLKAFFTKILNKNKLRIKDKKSKNIEKTSTVTKNHISNNVMQNFFNKKNQIVPEDIIPDGKQNQTWDLGKYLAELKEKDNIQFRNTTINKNRTKQKLNKIDEEKRLKIANQGRMKVQYSKSKSGK